MALFLGLESRAIGNPILYAHGLYYRNQHNSLLLSAQVQRDEHHIPRKRGYKQKSFVGSLLHLHPKLFPRKPKNAVCEWKLYYDGGFVDGFVHRLPHSIFNFKHEYLFIE